MIKKINSQVLSQEKLYKIAINYLSRFSTSSGNLRKFLLNKVSFNEVTNPKEIILWIDNVINSLTISKFLDDLSYSRNRATSLLRKGKPTKFIIMDLNSKNVDEDIIKKAIEYLENNNNEYDNLDYLAAINYLKRNNLGKIKSNTNKTININKHLARMVRAGFSYEISKKLLNSNFNFDKTI